MNDTIRELLLSEFNRLLPMARASIKRKLHILETEQEQKSLEVSLEQRQKHIDCCNQMVKLILEFENLDSDNSLAFEKLRIKMENNIAKYKMEQSQFESLLALSREQISENENIFILETCLCEAILSQLSCTEGFIQEDDINEEYIEEHIYLLILNYTGRKSFTNEKLFSFNASKLISLSKLSTVKEVVLSTQLSNQNTSAALFFSTFYDKNI